MRLLAALLLGLALGAGPITPEGRRLAARYDALDVEHLWLPGQHVDWRTGRPDNGRPAKTHCSAFVAAACEREGIYILRPPEHRAVKLATAQGAWLREAGAAAGWSPVPDPFQAQDLANGGRVVVVVWESPDPARSGHIALVRPSDKDGEALRREGPDIIQAGAANHARCSLREGFRHHRGAWVSAARHAARFFAWSPTPAGTRPY
ncbi:MAG TPA: hypothetical protein VK188_12580 [Holophaga sp.]|nr:hypothetical protein [Holophaga sp.]